MTRWMLATALAAALAIGCGDSDDKTSRAASATTEGADTALSAYATRVSGEFGALADARGAWEEAQGPSVRGATVDFLAACKSMRRVLATGAVPAQVRERHDTMLATLDDQIAHLEKLLPDGKLDTEAIDAEIYKTFEIEKIVGELYTLPGVEATPPQ
jgi:hypothetical protein